MEMPIPRFIAASLSIHLAYGLSTTENASVNWRTAGRRRALALGYLF